MQFRHRAVAGVIAAAALTAGGHPPAHPATTHVVSVRDDSFSRSAITIARNDRVRWAWRGTADSHNVTSGGGNPARFHSRTRSGSYRYSHKFTRAGTYRLHCTIHPDLMRITVKVKSRG